MGTKLSSGQVDTVLKGMDDWFAGDGLMKLTPEDERPPFGNEIHTTVNTDNGILNLVDFFWLKFLHEKLDWENDGAHFHSTVTSLRRVKDGESQFGLFNRNPSRDGRDEAHDNPGAIASGSVLLIFDEFIDEIVERGEQTGYIFENVEATEPQAEEHLKKKANSWWYKILGFDITRWRQGSNVAYYKLLKGWAPTPWEFLWLVGAYVFDMVMFRKIKKDGGYTSETKLAWQQLRAIERIYNQRINKDMNFRFGFYYKVILYVVLPLWKYFLNRATGGRGMEMVMEIFYQNEFHPNRLLSKGIIY